MALASKVRGSPIPTFTIQIADPQFDETSEAGIVSRHIGSQPVVVRFGAEEMLSIYPQLIEAAEGPVIDTSCGALMMLAREVHARGYKVALTGEGADEWLAGYPWYKVNKLLGFLDCLPGLPISQAVRRAYLRATGCAAPAYRPDPAQPGFDGGHNALARRLRHDVAQQVAILQSGHAVHRRRPCALRGPAASTSSAMRRWHPLNRGLCVGGRAHLAGLLLNAKGDRVAMHNSVETRYPFLDEEVFAFLARLHPRWKMRGFTDKYLLRKLAERHLPKSIAWRRKAMFRAPFDSFHADGCRRSSISCSAPNRCGRRATSIRRPSSTWRSAFRKMWPGPRRILVEMGLVGRRGDATLAPDVHRLQSGGPAGVRLNRRC